MTLAVEDPLATLTRLVIGYQGTQALRVVAVLKVADHVGDAPVAAEEIASRVGAHPESLYRLMRALATIGVFHETDDHLFTATPTSDLLRSDNPRSIAGWAEFVGSPRHWQVWGDFLETVRTGEEAPARLFGASIWNVREQHPDEIALFRRAMASLSLGAVGTILRNYDFSPYRVIVDVGGSDGTLLCAILERATDSRGIVFDQPHVVVGASDVIEGAGLSGRCETVGGSFFEGVPAGGDAYVVKSILHDWTDEDSVRILERVREAIPPAGTLVVIDAVLAPPNRGQVIAFSDLNMMGGPGGRERRLEEWEALLRKGGFELLRHISTGERFDVLEARPV